MKEIEISGSAFLEDLHGKLDAIASGQVYIVRQDDSDEVRFVIGPPDVCSALGLYDVEYGWPAMVQLEEIQSLRDLAPGGRRHPYVYRNQQAIAAIITFEEWNDLRSRRSS